MPKFDVTIELEKLPIGRDTCWSAPSLGASTSDFHGIHLALRRLEGYGKVQILEEDVGTDFPQGQVRRITFLRLSFHTATGPTPKMPNSDSLILQRRLAASRSMA